MLPRVALTVDGKTIEMNRDWMTTEQVNRGYDRLSARVSPDKLKQLLISEGDKVTLWNQAAEPIWYGTVSEEPLIEKGRAQLEASGSADDADKEAGRLLYQVAGTEGWSDAASNPFADSNESGLMELDIKPNALVWRVPGTGESLANGDRVGASFWANGTPGDLSRLAGTKVAVLGGANMDFRISKFNGPQGSKTLVADVGTGSGGISQGLGSTHDAVAILLRANTGFPNNASDRLRIHDLRVNGIADNTGRASSWDTWYVDELVSDIGTRLSWDNGGISEKDTNALPHDHEQGPFADVLDFAADLVDWYWLALHDTGSGPLLVFQAWGTNDWKIKKSRDAKVTLKPLRRYDSAVVPYQDARGRWRQSTATAASPPGTGFVFEAEPLPDLQRGSSVADAAAQVYADRYAAERYSGTIEIVSANDVAGRDSPENIHPGDTLTIEDFDVGKSVTVRVHSKQMRDNAPIQLGIEAPVSVFDIVTQAQLRKARRRRRR